MRHLYFPPNTTCSHHLQRHLSSILNSCCWGNGTTRNSSRVPGPPCRGIVNHAAGEPTSILDSRGHLDHQTGNKPANIPCDSLVIGRPAVSLSEGIIRYAAIAGNARGPQPWRARPRSSGGSGAKAMRWVSFVVCPPLTLTPTCLSSPVRSEQRVDGGTWVPVIKPPGYRCGRAPRDAKRND